MPTPPKTAAPALKRPAEPTDAEMDAQAEEWLKSRGFMDPNTDVSSKEFCTACGVFFGPHDSGHERSFTYPEICFSCAIDKMSSEIKKS